MSEILAGALVVALFVVFALLQRGRPLRPGCGACPQRSGEASCGACHSREIEP